MVPLGLLVEGESGEIVAVRGDLGTLGTRAEDMGLRVGCRVEMLNGRASPVLVRVDESRIAIDRGAAMRISVRRDDE